MRSLVADTHAVLWYLCADQRLSPRAKEAIDAATLAGMPIYVPTICVVEATYLIEKGRIASVSIAQLDLALNMPRAAFQAVHLTGDIAFRLKEIPRSEVPDLPDRVIAATALVLGLPLVTRDAKIQGSKIETIW
jgi:PIN domain nuclease of toxin-antitoxin system